MNIKDMDMKAIKEAVADKFRPAKPAGEQGDAVAAKLSVPKDDAAADSQGGGGAF